MIKILDMILGTMWLIIGALNFFKITSVFTSLQEISGLIMITLSAVLINVAYYSDKKNM